MSQERLYYILFDSETSQVERQASTGTRLNSLFGALTSVFGVTGSSAAWPPPSGNNPLQFTPVTSGSNGPQYGPITSGSLNGVKVLAILTRWNYATDGSAPFSAGEINAIQQWVSGGGSLLLMSNHGRFPRNSTVWSQNDAALASAFGFSLGDVGITNQSSMLRMSGSNFSRPTGPALSGARQIFSGVTSIGAHDGCGITLGQNVSGPGGSVTYSPLVSFPVGAYVYAPTGTPPTGEYPSGQYFAACAQYYRGKVVVVANSGMVGDVGNRQPAAGLAPYGNNLLFVLNAFSWLAGIPAWNPVTGRPLNGG